MNSRGIRHQPFHATRPRIGFAPLNPSYARYLASRKSRKKVFFGGGDAVAEAAAALAVRARSSAGGARLLVSSPSEGREVDDCGAVSPALGGGSSGPLRPHAVRPSAAATAAARAGRLHRSTDLFTCAPPVPDCPCKSADRLMQVCKSFHANLQIARTIPDRRAGASIACVNSQVSVRPCYFLFSPSRDNHFFA